jgi:8-amino-7-oxononanoate synthase
VNLIEEINQRKEKGLFRSRKVLRSAQGPLIKIDDKELINFSSNDYLGLANHEQLKAHMKKAIDEYGIGAGSSQLVVGYSEPHEKLEHKLASFLKREAALVFSTGYQANLAVASVLINSNTIVLQDKLNHASLIDAARLSDGRLVRYRHNDVRHLESLLKKHKQQDLLVMTDGVFSMDGYYAPLIEITELCKRYNALLLVDDAHGIGVLGDAGGGLLEELNLDQGQVPLLIGTFGKSFGAAGAFVSGSQLHIEAFIQKARTYIYTTALLPSLAETLVHAIDIVSNGKQERDHIKSLIKHYKFIMSESGLTIEKSNSHIQPFIVGDAEAVMSLGDALYKDNILAATIRPPTVPKDTARLRISITALHSKEHIDSLINSIRKNLNEC